MEVGLLHEAGDLNPRKT